MTAWIAADGLRGIADNTTSTVLALLSLIAVAVLGYGLTRAVISNRRPQIVLTDLVAPGGAELAGPAMLSPVARQYLREQIADQRTQIARIRDDILSPVSRELDLHLGGDDIDRQIQRSANDSIVILLAAMRAITPDAADRFLGLFSAILPPPRGVAVNIALFYRGAGTAPRAGACAEIVALDGRPVASKILWEPSPAVSPPTRPAERRPIRQGQSLPSSMTGG